MCRVNQKKVRIWYFVRSDSGFPLNIYAKLEPVPYTVQGIFVTREPLTKKVLLESLE